jgi:apolipoprotein N-acyltransferase
VNSARFDKGRIRTKDLVLACLSAALLLLAFPTFNLGILAWFALVPLLLALEGKSLRATLILCYVTGLLSTAGILSWLWKVSGVTLVHIVFVFGYLALYVAIWGGAVYWVRKRTSLPLALVAPPLWVAQEYVRSHFFFLGFPFMLLGHSQYLHPSVIQIASITGTYGLSYLIVLVNAIVAEMILFSRQSERSVKNLFSCSGPLLTRIALGILCLVVTVSYGFSVIADPAEYDQERIALIQGNIPRSSEWSPGYSDEILGKYANLTRQSSQRTPKLIIWPESAVPGYVLQNGSLREQVASLAKEVGTYLLVGNSEYGKFENQELKRKYVSKKQTLYHNSMVLFSPQGQVEGRYRKIELVPFGEYIPLKDYVRWPKAIAPVEANFLPGDEFTVFDVGGTPVATMICWEVMYPELFREFVKRGAALIVSAHNAVWFNESPVTYQYLAVSAILAAQHRRAVATVGNTGATALTDPYGNIVKRLRSPDDRELFVEGILVGDIAISHDMTFYTKYGEVFAFLQLAVCGLLLLFALIKNWIMIPTRRRSQLEPISLHKDLLHGRRHDAADRPRCSPP